MYDRFRWVNFSEYSIALVYDLVLFCRVSVGITTPYMSR